MSQKRKQRAAAPRDLSFGAVQRKLAEEGRDFLAARELEPLEVER